MAENQVPRDVLWKSLSTMVRKELVSRYQGSTPECDRAGPKENALSTWPKEVVTVSTG